MQGRLSAFLLAETLIGLCPLCLSLSVAISPLCHLHSNIFLAATLCQRCWALPVIQPERSEAIPYFNCCCSVLPSSSSSAGATSFPLKPAVFSPLFFPDGSKQKQPDVQFGWWISAVYMSVQPSLENITSRMELNVQEKRWHVVTTLKHRRAVGP